MNDYITKYPNRVPVVINHDRGIILTKNRFMVSCDMNVSELLMVIKKRCCLQPHESIFLICENDGTLPSGMTTLYALNQTHRSPDKILYLRLIRESSFG